MVSSYNNLNISEYLGVWIMTGPRSLVRNPYVYLTAILVFLVLLSYYSIRSLRELEAINANVAAWLKPLSINPSRLQAQQQLLRDYTINPSNALLQRIETEQLAFLNDLLTYQQVPVALDEAELLAGVEHTFRATMQQTRQYLWIDNDLVKGQIIPQQLGQSTEAVERLYNRALIHYQGELERFHQRVHDTRVATLSLLGVAGALCLFAFRMQGGFYQMIIDREKIELENYTDGLTGARNYKYLIKQIQERTRFQRSYTLFLLDLDDFKKVNDIHGHIVGDEALRHVVHSISGILRPTDLLCRYGGEEFVIVSDVVQSDHAHSMAERFRLSVAETPFTFGSSEEPAVLALTVSIGLATYIPSLQNDVLKAADGALYAAKRGGKNRVCSFEENAGQTPSSYIGIGS
jgi:diguanylate cyclase (GGDEF)-like protein